MQNPVGQYYGSHKAPFQGQQIQTQPFQQLYHHPRVGKETHLRACYQNPPYSGNQVPYYENHPYPGRKMPLS